MTTSPDILAKQQAYAARPFLAYIRTSHFSGGFRFDTEAEAVAYIFQQFHNVRVAIAYAAPGDNARNWKGFDAWRSELVRPGGERIPAAYVLMHDGLSSSREDAR